MPHHMSEASLGARMTIGRKPTSCRRRVSTSCKNYPLDIVGCSPEDVSSTPEKRHHSSLQKVKERPQTSVNVKAVENQCLDPCLSRSTPFL